MRSRSTLRPERVVSSWCRTSTASGRPNRPDETGQLTGLRTDVTPGQLAQAAIEGVVCNLLAGADALGETAKGTVFLVGGAAHSRAYRHVVSDLTGRAVRVPADDELVAAGAAVQAAALHHGGDFAEVAGTGWGLGRGDHGRTGRRSRSARHQGRLRRHGDGGTALTPRHAVMADVTGASRYPS